MDFASALLSFAKAQLRGNINTKLDALQDMEDYEEIFDEISKGIDRSDIGEEHKVVMQRLLVDEFNSVMKERGVDLSHSGF